ncbi:MAG: anthranilate synthase component I [Candidatus Margulisbacteria bacterium]|nr:anthranilate synthase component I [Candidatus Margulisiibacteriota bacterium]
MYYPNKQEFIRLSKRGNLIPVYKEIVADMETPVSAYRKIEDKYSFLLESVEGGEKIARYSFLGASHESRVASLGSLEEIRELLRQYKPVKVEGLPRFHGGLVGYVGYDMIREIEDIPDKNPDDLKLPPLLFILTDTILAFDHLKHKIIIISNAEVKGNPGKAYKEACLKIDQLERKLKKPLKLEQEELEIPLSTRSKLPINSNMTQKQYEAIVKKAKDHIRAGDVIQVVLSQRFETACSADPFNVYRVLRTINPSPYMYYLRLGELKVAGSSPEVMVRFEGGEATVRPIAGTRRRGVNEQEDKKLAKELLASVKERAEHLMLVDLGRNDLGRVCEFGSVKVTEEMVIEKYSHVMHIVSNVTGRLKKTKDAVDLLMATFPAGTVSGAPKVRAMEIIDELENVRRGPYAGCVGYFGFSGELDTCITIRTILFKGKKAYIQVGAGIVADSVPSQEYKETVNKATAMLRAIELTS